MPSFTIGLIQDHATADVPANVARAERLVREAARRGAQIVCLKELFNALYFCKSQQCDRFDLAEPIPGPTTDAMQALARELAIVIIVLICWDQWYPEAARITSLMGAEVLFYPTAIGWHPAEKDEWGRAQVDAWRTIQRAHAIANGVYVASPNRIGHEDEPGTNGITFFGHSFIADPFGRYVAEAAEAEEVVIAQCDPGLIETVRRNWPFLRDRRVDAYGPILNRYLGS